MPYKPNRPCRYPGCVNTTPSKQGYCETHAHHYQPPRYPSTDNRPSAAARGYGKDWQAIRAEVLRSSGIPKELWHLYDVHHEPEYNPAIEPNHRNYKLTPMLHNAHSRHTSRARGRGIKSLGDRAETDNAQPNFHTIKMGGF